MKAIRVSQFGGPEVLKLETVPDPKPAKGQILIRVRAAGVNPVDTYIRSGAYGPLNFPYTPGKDAAGVVEEKAEGVEQFRVGDRVYSSGSVSGTYAELTLCDAADVHPLPKQISFAQGAALGVPYATAYRSLFQRGKGVAAETVLIHGASGGVGLAAVQWARAAGLTVIGTAGTDEGRKLVSKEGAHHILDHRAPNYLDQALALTAGRGVDIILEMLANVNLGKDLPILAKHGRVVVIGSRGKVEITPRDLMSREADIRAMVLFNASREEFASIHAAIYAGLENGTLRPVVGKEMPLAEAAKAHVAVMAPGAYGKIVLTP
jgi:NADPH2:quinone reductase